MNAQPTLSDASVAALDAEIAREAQGLEDALAQQAALAKDVVARRARLGAARAQRNMHVVLTQSCVADWGALLAQGSAELARKRQSLLAPAGMGCSGYWTDSDQAAVRFELQKGRPNEVEAALALTEALLPHVIADAMGFKRFGIFESGLSAYGAWRVYIDQAAGSFEIRSARAKQSFGSLRALIQQVHDQFYYNTVEEQE